MVPAMPVMPVMLVMLVIVLVPSIKGMKIFCHRCGETVHKGDGNEEFERYV